MQILFMKNSIKVIIKCFVIVIASILVGFLLMVGVYSLPTDTIVNHVEESAPLFEEGSNKVSNWANDYSRYSKIDTSTDSLMLLEAVCRDYDSVIENALLNPRYALKEEVKGKDKGSDVALYLDKNNIDGVTTYGRYWHGYLLYMIPGLFIFNYGELRVLLMSIELILTVLLAFELGKLDKKYMFAYLAMVIFINPISVALNFVYAFVYLLMMTLSLFVIRKNDFLNRNNNIVYFSLIDGILVAFFDYLTYPMVAWGVPLVIYLIINKFDLKKSLTIVALCGLSFIFGYGLMWFGKWVLASLLTSENIIKNGIDTVRYRSIETPTGYENMNFKNTLHNIFLSFDDRAMKLIEILSFVSLIVYLIVTKHKLKINKDFFSKNLPILLIGFSSYAWYFVVMNHSYTHPFMEYRELGVTIFADLVLICNMFKRKDKLN